MPQQKKKKDPKGSPAPAFRILIVDDKKENRYLLESMFGAKGYMTESAANGIEAQGHLKKEHFDVIISDLLMPKMDGFQLLRECKKDPLLNKIPFIIYTATYTDKKDIEFGLSLGAARYIIKPAEPDVLLYQLDEIIKQSTEEVVEEPGSTVEDNEKFDKEYIRHVTAKLDKKILDLEKSEERYRTLAEASPDQIFIVGKDDTIKFANTALLKLFRLPYDQVVGTPRKNLFPPDIADSQSIHFKKVFETGEMLKTGERIQFGTQEFWIDTSLVPLKDKTGNVTAVLGVSRDTTERKQAEEEIRKLNAELEQRVRDRTAQLEAANKELEAFSYSVSHDLRAPLRAIDGFSRVVLEDYIDKLDDEGKRFLNIIRGNTKKMGQLIDDLLEFSRLGRQEIRTSGIDMGKLAKAVSEELKLAVPERKLKFTINTLIPAQGDQAMIRQVFVNLLSNAVKFTRPKERAVIEVDGRSEGNENVYTVKDNGVGFDMQYVNKLFGVFQRLHSSEEFEGTGVGLAIVQRIIHRHGGRVWAEGKVGEGATFYFSLPAKK